MSHKHHVTSSILVPATSKGPQRRESVWGVQVEAFVGPHCLDRVVALGVAHARLAQRIEHRFYIPRAGGSNPSSCTFSGVAQPGQEQGLWKAEVAGSNPAAATLQHIHQASA